MEYTSSAPRTFQIPWKYLKHVFITILVILALISATRVVGAFEWGRTLERPDSLDQPISSGSHLKLLYGMTITLTETGGNCGFNVYTPTQGHRQGTAASEHYPGCSTYADLIARLRQTIASNKYGRYVNEALESFIRFLESGTPPAGPA